ncbi:MAG: hypothetical protein IKT15_02665 [Firmicutes bacterium]|nr:hypothetical protein [Bacillota bacterium]
MNITLTLGETCMLLIAIALFILLIYCINLVRHLIPSIKKLNNVMTNVETITDSAAKSTTSAEGIVDDVLDVTSSLVSSVKGPVGLVGQATSVVNAIQIIMSLINDKKTNLKIVDKDIEVEESSETTVETEPEQEGGADE